MEQIEKSKSGKSAEPNACEHLYKYHESTFRGSLFKFIECTKCGNRQYLS